MPFDPYYTWLGIPPGEQPPHHYRLLGLTLFETSGDAICNAGDRQMAHVRTFQNGPHAGVSQQLLKDIALARICLLDSQQKAAYDQQLRTKIARQTNETTELPAAQLPRAKAEPVPVVLIPEPAAQPQRPTLTASSSEEPRRKHKNPAVEFAKIAVGGLVGIALSLLVLRYGLQMDVTGLLPVRSKRPIASVPPPAPPDIATQANSRPLTNPPDNEPTNTVALPAPTSIAPLEPPALVPTNPPPPHENAPTKKTKSGKGVKGKKPAAKIPTEPSVSAPSPAIAPEIPPASAGSSLRAARLPVPPEAERLTVAKQMEALLETPKPKTDEDRLALVAKLLALGNDKMTADVERYAALWRASELAAAVGDAQRVAQAAAKLTTTFEIPPLVIEEPRLMETAKAARTASQLDALVLAMRPAIEFALAEGNYDAALGLVNATYAACNNPQGRQHQKWIAEGKKEIARQSAAWKTAQDAFVKLQAAPNDPAAHLAVAKWLILERSDWIASLPHLTHVADPLVKQAAEPDLAGPATSQAQLAAADAWYTAGQGPQSETFCLTRALFWMEQVRRGGLQGLELAKADRRIDELQQSEPVKALRNRLQTAAGLGGLSDKLPPVVRRHCVAAFTFSGSDLHKVGGNLTLIDKSGRQNHGRVQGTSVAPGRAGQSFRFEQPEDFIECAEAPSLNPSAELTLAAWVRPERWVGGNNEALDYVISKDDWKSAAPRGYVLRLTDRGRPNLTLSTGRWSHLKAPAPIQLGEWTHVVGVYDGRQLVVLVNGEEVAQASFTSAIVPSPFPLRIGKGTYAQERHFVGELDEVAVFDVPLTASDVRALYELGRSGVSLAR